MHKGKKKSYRDKVNTHFQDQKIPTKMHYISVCY